jgi:hypothetical protein
LSEIPLTVFDAQFKCACWPSTVSTLLRSIGLTSAAPSRALDFPA